MFTFLFKKIHNFGGEGCAWGAPVARGGMRESFSHPLIGITTRKLRLQKLKCR